ncbi:MAG: PTS sugar transporter subunit IIA [Phycisphaerales bacterium]|nr:PTS sugar transporter subunit IIA [Phycisphaerales bacterium]
MKLLDFLYLNSIKAPLTAANKQGAIEELVDVLATAGRVENARQLKDAVWTREMTRTTGIGDGLAIPHGKSPSVTQLAIAMGKPASPMDFASIDGKPVRLIILLASPQDKTSEHIQALASISKLMSMAEFRQRVYSASSSQEIYDLFKSQEGGGGAA